MPLNIQNNNTFRNNWLARFSNNENIGYKVINIPLPEMRIDGQRLGTCSNVDIQLSGAKVEFSPINLTFIVDENFDNYISIAKWIANNSVKTEEYDLEIDILDGKGNEQGVKFKFFDVFPESLSNPELDSNSPDRVICNATLRFTKFTIGEIDFEQPDI